MRDLDAKELTSRHRDTGTDALPLIARDSAAEDKALLHRFSPSVTGTVLATAASCDVVADPRLASRSCANRTASGRASKSHRRRSLVALGVLLVALLSLISGTFTVGEEHGGLLPSAAEISAESLAWNASLSVLVLHREPLTCLDKTQVLRREKGLASRTVMRRTQLPSWTLHVVEAACAECLDSATHAAAVARQLGNRSDTAAAAVFATPSAPLGLAGPMLFAMASVTDDVAVGAELARWGWVGRSQAVRRQFAGASPVGLKGGTTPYLVVSGIPSVDQPLRASLRDAQRATWLSYRDVARSENGFDGALLPLYIFAAAERELSQGVTDMSPLLPTVAEYDDASTMLLRDDDDDDDEETTTPPAHEVRRVELIHGLQGMGAHDPRLPESPCVKIITKSYEAGTDVAPTWVSQLASALQLPVRPAAVAPAEFICHASAALWQEALAHRNMLWVDMMTDRRPTSNKKMGEGGNWGLPVEVGMSQKLVLWLEYAYHAFPDVPYIMKSDDDTYLKVPQFVRDIRYIRAGFQNDKMLAPRGLRDPIGIEQTEECIYWGGQVRSGEWDSLRYHGGNGYMLHRRMVRAVIEDTDELNARTLRYAVTPFNVAYKHRYEELLMNVEDMFVGRMLRDKRRRLREVCPFKRALYIEEAKSRMLDTHMARRPIGWAAMLLHHVSPFDEYYLHYYFQHEHAVAERIRVNSHAVVRAAVKDAKTYMQSLVPPTMGGYGRFTKFQWEHPKGIPGSFIAEGDNVSVYALSYKKSGLKALDVTFAARFRSVA